MIAITTKRVLYDTLLQCISVSEQQLVDCDKSDNGCDGGLPELADKWLIAKDVGLEYENEYPYHGIVEKCHQNPKKERIFVNNFLKISTIYKFWCVSCHAETGGNGKYSTKK